MSIAPPGSDLPVLLDAARIEARIRKLAAQISRDYEGSTPHVVGVLKGAGVHGGSDPAHFHPVHRGFSEYPKLRLRHRVLGEVKITKDLDVSIDGRDVLLVEDILDTRPHFQLLAGSAGGARPASLKLVALLDKHSRRIIPVRRITWASRFPMCSWSATAWILTRNIEILPTYAISLPLRRLVLIRQLSASDLIFSKSEPPWMR